MKGVKMTRAARQQALERLQTEEAEVWFEYLDATRGQSAKSYAEIEPWAWVRLSQHLRAIRSRRNKLRPVAA